jgi:hypothetical protein
MKDLVKEYETVYWNSMGLSYSMCVKRTDNLLANSTWTLCKDGYFDKIPDHYYTKNNQLLCLGLILIGNAQLLQKAINVGCKLYIDTCFVAAKFGHLDIVKLAKANGCIWDYMVAAGASACGHLNILQWAIKNDCKWHIEISNNAAYNGHLHILKWIRTCGMLNGDEENYAAKRGHLHILKWLKEKGRLRNIAQVTMKAIEHEQPHILLWCISNGSNIAKTMYDVGMENGNLTIISLLKEHYISCDDDSYVNMSDVDDEAWN